MTLEEYVADTDYGRGLSSDRSVEVECAAVVGESAYLVSVREIVSLSRMNPRDGRTYGVWRARVLVFGEGCEGASTTLEYSGGAWRQAIPLRACYWPEESIMEIGSTRWELAVLR